MDDWKTFLLKYKWIPTSVLIDQFNLNKYDIDNYRRKTRIHTLLKPWRISYDQSPDRLSEIFTEAWKYYLNEVCKIDFTTSKEKWVPELISLKNISRNSGFSFLTNSKYLEIICPETLEEFRSHGFTNIAIGTFQFWPGMQFLTSSGVLPFMFYQTHKNALQRISIEDMVEHVYLSFLAEGRNKDLKFAKEIFYARHDERGFVTTTKLARYGVPQNFYNGQGGLKIILKKIAEKFAKELGYVDDENFSWSASDFRKRYPELNLEKCKYCGLSPVDLHHLLPRNQFPSLAYHVENVVPLCIQVHGLITRNYWLDEYRKKYETAMRKWGNASDGYKVDVFDDIMMELHEFIYGHVKN